MEEADLLGYLLHALEPDAERDVENYLRDHPQAQEQLARLRRAIAPLAVDVEEFEPPHDLVVRTIARVAEYRCRPLPRAPVQPFSRHLAVTRSFWRRADLAVAAGILFCAAVITFPALHQLRLRHDRLACENNLRVIGTALREYADRGSDGRFPDITRAYDTLTANHAVAAPQNTDQLAAGLFIPMLVQAGDLQAEQIVRLNCPGADRPQESPVLDLAKLRRMSAEDFRHQAAELAPTYAYTLGYRDGGEVRGLTREDGVMPIVADSPRVDRNGFSLADNSGNHGGRGQNVLFTDGHVEWTTGRFWNNDDFFINQANRLEAGLNSRDYVLGPSDSRP